MRIPWRGAHNIYVLTREVTVKQLIIERSDSSAATATVSLLGFENPVAEDYDTGEKIEVETVDGGIRLEVPNPRFVRLAQLTEEAVEKLGVPAENAAMLLLEDCDCGHTHLRLGVGSWQTEVELVDGEQARTYTVGEGSGIAVIEVIPMSFGSWLLLNLTSALFEMAGGPGFADTDDEEE